MNKRRRTISLSGEVNLICGPMFAGKTEELIRRIKRDKRAKKNVLVFKPEIDDRYSDDQVASHNGEKCKSYVINKNPDNNNLAVSKDILKYIDKDVDTVAIDEVQFFDYDIVSIVDYLADQGIKVIVTGLDRDFRGVPFKNVNDIASFSEHIQKLTAICQCGAPATRTQRLVNDEPAHYNDPIIMVGASESYEPRCRYCHDVPGKPYDKEIIQHQKRLEKSIDSDII